MLVENTNKSLPFKLIRIMLTKFNIQLKFSNQNVSKILKHLNSNVSKLIANCFQYFVNNFFLLFSSPFHVNHYQQRFDIIINVNK